MAETERRCCQSCCVEHAEDVGVTPQGQQRGHGTPAALALVAVVTVSILAACAKPNPAEPDPAARAPWSGTPPTDLLMYLADSQQIPEMAPYLEEVRAHGREFKPGVDLSDPHLIMPRFILSILPSGAYHIGVLPPESMEGMAMMAVSNHFADTYGTWAAIGGGIRFRQISSSEAERSAVPSLDGCHAAFVGDDLLVKDYAGGIRWRWRKVDGTLRPRN